MPDGCKQIGPNKLIRVKTAFDWIVTFQGRTALIDTKTINACRFNHSQIDENQANELFMHERSGAIAGYVICLREINQVIFVSSRKLVTKMMLIGSIGVDDGFYLGSHFEFDVKKIFLGRENGDDQGRLHRGGSGFFGETSGIPGGP